MGFDPNFFIEDLEILFNIGPPNQISNHLMEDLKVLSISK